MPERTTLAVGLIGAGGMGARHARNLHEQVGGAALAGVYDVDGGRAKAVAAACGGATVYNDPSRLIRDPAIAAVIVASPDATHLDFTLACLAAEKPVLCEKPLATSASDALKVIDTEVALGRRLVSIGLMRRFDPYHVAVREAVTSGQLGRAVLYKGVHRNAAIPYDSRGEVILTNSAGHDVDAVRWLLGEEIASVYVQGIRSHAAFSPQTTDLLLMQMALTGACLATVEVYAAAEYGYEVTAEVVGELGVATSGRPDRALIRAESAAAVALPCDWLERFQDAYVIELRDWVRSVQPGGTFAGASAWDGLMTLLVTDACVQSLQTGAPVAVQRPARPPLY